MRCVSVDLPYSLCASFPVGRVWTHDVNNYFYPTNVLHIQTTRAIYTGVIVDTAVQERIRAIVEYRVGNIMIERVLNAASTRIR